MDKTLFSKPEHFYEKGKHEPVLPDEQRELRRKARYAKISLYFLLLATITGIIYFVALFLNSIGYRPKHHFQMLAIAWLILATMAFFIIEKYQ